MGTAGAASSVVVLGVLCAALASVADVEAAKKATPALGRSLGGLGAPAAATAPAKITPLAAAAALAKTAALAALAASTKTTAVAARAASTTASKRSAKPASATASATATHRATRKPGAPSGDDAGTGSTAAAAAATSATAAATTASPGAGSGREGQEVEANLTDVAVLKSALPNKPFIKPGMYPFIATVQKTCGACHTRQFCAGAILAPQWVISMPQCAETHPGEGLLVRAGDSFIWPGDHTPTQKVIEVVWHEAATSTDDYPKYDVILMRLENSFQFGENINAIALAPPTHPAEGALSMVGWTTPGHAEQVELNVTHGTVRGTEECQKIAPQEALPADTLCVQPVEPLPDRCGYDLGDPVFVEAEQPLLVGLLSRWYLPCVPDRPVVALKISSIYAWVYEKVNPPPVTPRPAHSTAEATTTTTAATASTPTTPSAAPTHSSSTSPLSTVPPPTTPLTTPLTTPTTTPLPPSPPSSSALPATTTPPPTTPSPTTPTSTVTASSPTGSSTSTPPRPASHVKPMTVSSSSASGALSNTSSTSDAALLAGHMESSLSYSLGTASVDAAKPALANSVSVGWANCRDIGGALGMSYALAYSFIGEGAATAASTVNATCLEMNAVQSQGWSISTSGGSAPVSVRAFVMEHLASIPGLPRQPTLKYL